MHLHLLLLLICLAGFSHQDDTAAVSEAEGVGEAEPTTETGHIPTTPEFDNFADVTTVAGLPTQPAAAVQPPQPQQFQASAASRSRPALTRRRPRRQHYGHFNDARYRNPANNPNNPSSPYAFRGRPGQPPPAGQPQQYYDPRYYDPYAQATQDAYYAYTGYYYGYPPPNYPPHQQHQQQPYPPQPQPPQPHPPQPYQPPPPTEQVPELYYLQSPESPDGQYQYKKVSVQSETGGRGNRRRPQRQQPAAYGQQQASYPYAYNPYDPYRQAYYPPQDYPQQQQQQGYQPQYNYPPYQYQQSRGLRGARKLRSGLPPRPTPDPRAWRLTSAPARLDITDAPQPHSDLPDVPPAPSNTREDTTSDQPVTAGAGE